MMNDIYTVAELVLIWAGDGKGVPPNEAKDSGKHISLLEHRIVREIGKSDYWRRLWIVQEVLLAKDITVLFGPEVSRWYTMHNILHREAEFRDLHIISRMAN